MSSRLQEWLCRGCGQHLGFVVKGDLAPDVRVTVDRTGKLKAECPKCGQVRMWVPEREVTSVTR